MSTPIRSPLSTSTYPVYPGLAKVNGAYVSVKTTQEDIDMALEQGDLNKARDAIYDCYGKWSFNTQKQFLRIIEKIVELNANELSPEHEELKYTLDKAHSLGCDIYTMAFNDQRHGYDVAVAALKLLAEGYEKKKEYSKAVDSLTRLGGYMAKEYQDPILSRWKNYIANECPQDQKERQEYLHESRERQVLNYYNNSPEMQKRWQIENSASYQLRKMGL